MQQIQLTNEQAKELEMMTRPITPADQTALNQAYAELDKKGFVFSGENFMILIRAYNDSPQAPITVQNVLEFTNKYRDSFQWLSADEAQYRLYEKEYPAELETIRKFLPTYSLSASVEDESLYVNTNIIMEYCISTNRIHQISKETLQTMIGNLINRPGARALRWGKRPLQDSEKESLRRAEEAQKAADHYKQYHKELDPEYQQEQRLKRQAEEIDSSNNTYWQQRVRSFINSIQSHVLRGEAEQQFGQKAMNANWQVNFVSLEHWYDRKKNSGGHWY